MRKLLIATVALPLMLGGCNTPSPAVSVLVNSAIGQSIIANLVDSAFPQASAVIAKGAAASKADLQLVAYWLPWLNKAVAVFGPSLGMSAAQVAAADATTATLVAQLQNPPTDAGSLLADVYALFSNIKTDLKPVTG